MNDNRDRERVIRAAWEERGKAEWDQETHGRGLLSLHIPAKIEMRPVRVGAPLPPYDNLDFHLVRATMRGQPVTSIVCEDVVVETIEDAAHQPMNPVPKQPSGTILNIRPQEPPPHTAGMQAGAGTAFQGEAPLTITFADGEAVARWLNGQSQEVAAAFAARAASSRALAIRSESRSAARPPGRAMRPAPRAVSVKASSAPCAMPTIGETSAVGPKVG